MAILFVSAEAGELKPFADGLTALRKLKWPVDWAYEGILEGRRILLAANGAGPKLASQVVEIAIRAGMVAELSSSRLEAVVSTGYCGALDPALELCQIVVASKVINVTGETLECGTVDSPTSFTWGPVLSQDAVANDHLEKQRLAETGALAVEMEAAGIGARTNRAGLPFYCIKAVTDCARESFPFDLNRMRTPEGRIDRGKIVRHAVSHPNVLGGLFQMKRRAENAARALGDFLGSCRIVTALPVGLSDSAES